MPMGLGGSHDEAAIDGDTGYRGGQGIVARETCRRRREPKLFSTESLEEMFPSSVGDDLAHHAEAQQRLTEKKCVIPRKRCQP